MNSHSERQRTYLQNRSLHKYCELLAQELNEAGITQRMLLEGLEIDHSPESIKALMRIIGQKKYGKKSTADWTIKECMDIHEEMNRITTSKGVHVPWPSNEPNPFME